MNETMVTLSGWLGGDVTLRETGDGTSVATFRVASTPRRFNRRTGEWSDGDTQWYTVSAWRALADNCAESLRRGDPVVLHGRLSAQTWTNSAGMAVTSYEVDAMFVGHDLSRGTARFTRTPRPEVAPDATGPREPEDTTGGAPSAAEERATAAA